jgi:hypothetical protein
LSNGKSLVDGGAEITRRTRLPGTTIFLDLTIDGDPDNFVERTIRIGQLPPAQTAKARAAMLLATPQKTGRVTPWIAPVPAQD